MGDLEKIDSIIEAAREHLPSARYNQKMLDFLFQQMEKLEGIGQHVQKRKKRSSENGNAGIWKSVLRVLDRAELLIRRHAEPFDLQKFYKVATVEEGVKDLCGGLRNCVEELILDGYLPQGSINIAFHLDDERVREDKTYMYWYLAYILEGKQSELQLNDATQQEWEGLKNEHEGRIERLLLITDSERDKIHWGKPIGSGGSSQVYSARWRDIDVAVKKLADSERHLSHEALASFFTEVEIQMAMNYPYVVRLYAVSKSGLMLMELATANLALLYQQKLSLTWALKAKLLSQAAQGLEYVHDRGVVHRDVKSLNFLVFGSSPENYIVKVADFGLAYMKTETRTRTGRQLGSPLWMAPEVHEGRFHSFKSDVFSFGVVMYEVAGQSLPYKGATPDVLVGRKRRKRDPCVIPEDCPPALLKLMRMCIVPEPGLRPTMKFVATKLNDIHRQLGESIEAPSSPPLRTPSPVHSHTDVDGSGSGYGVPSGIETADLANDLASLEIDLALEKNGPSYMQGRDRPPVPIARRPPVRKGYASSVGSAGSKGSSLPSISTISPSTEEWLKMKESELKRTQDDRRTLLHKAAEEGHLEAAEVLVMQGDHNRIDKLGWTPLHDAAREGRTSIVQLLLASGADPSIQDIGGETPLHLAAFHQHMKVVELLLSNGADQGVKNNWGNTALHVACMRRNLEVAALLLEKGSDPCVKNKNGKFPQDLGGSSVEELFRGYESCQSPPDKGSRSHRFRRFFTKG